jgi:hypothetical protein
MTRRQFIVVLGGSGIRSFVQANLVAAQMSNAYIARHTEEEYQRYTPNG